MPRPGTWFWKQRNIKVGKDSKDKTILLESKSCWKLSFKMAFFYFTSSTQSPWMSVTSHVMVEAEARRSRKSLVEGLVLLQAHFCQLLVQRWAAAGLLRPRFHHRQARRLFSWRDDKFGRLNVSWGLKSCAHVSIFMAPDTCFILSAGKVIFFCTFSRDKVWVGQVTNTKCSSIRQELLLGPFS